MALRRRIDRRRRRILRHVTPLTPGILFNLVTLQTFTWAYVMTDGGPNDLFLVFYD